MDSIQFDTIRYISHNHVFCLLDLDNFNFDHRNDEWNVLFDGRESNHIHQMLVAFVTVVQAHPVSIAYM